MSNRIWSVDPIALELVLYKFNEIASGDSFLQGADDEIFINGVAFDTSELSPQHTLPTHAINLPSGDVSDPSVNSVWLSDSNPYVVYRFALGNSGVYPRTCTVQLQVVEEDSEDINETFKKIDEKYRAKLSEEVSKLGAQALGELGNSVAQGSGPVIKEISRTILDAVVPVAFAALADAISSGLANDAFMADPFTMLIPHKNYDFNDANPASRVYAQEPPEWCWTPLLSSHINTGSEHYEFVYYWKLQRQVTFVDRLSDDMQHDPFGRRPVIVRRPHLGRATIHR
jgi:hypothetical protein